MVNSSSFESRDIAARTKTFRNSLIEEFRLSESDTSSAFEAPKYSSDAFRNPNTVAEVLRHKPHALIKFKIFKRQIEGEEEEKENLEEKRRQRKPGRLQKATATLTVREWADWLLNTRFFSLFIIFAIATNAVIMGIQTFLDEIENWREMQIIMIIDNAITVAFIYEILLKWIVSFKNFWKDEWNRFDFIVTVGAIIPLVVELTKSDTTGQNTGDFSGIAKTLRIFRTFRTLKMIAKSRSLRIIVRTIMEALQSLGFVLILLALLMYIFSILAIDLFEGYTKSTAPGLQYQEKFSDITQALMTLFQLLTLDQWANISREIMQSGVGQVWTIIYFVVWVALGAFIFRNIFIGVMVKNFQSISQELSQLDQASRKKARMQKNVQELHDQLVEKKRQTIYVPSAGDATGGGAVAAATASVKDSNSAENPAQVISPKSSLLEQAQKGAANPQADAADSEDYVAKGDEWQKFVIQSLQVFQEQDPGTTLWARDTLLDYLQTMERLQENIKEYQELQHLASLALFNIVTDS